MLRIIYSPLFKTFSLSGLFLWSRCSPNSSKIANGLGAGKFNRFAGFIAFKFWSKFPHPVSSFVTRGHLSQTRNVLWCLPTTYRCTTKHYQKWPIRQFRSCNNKLKYQRCWLIWWQHWRHWRLGGQYCRWATQIDLWVWKIDWNDCIGKHAESMNLHNLPLKSLVWWLFC